MNWNRFQVPRRLRRLQPRPSGRGSGPVSGGFTLLEVMVAVTILGLGLTVILSSQAGLMAAIQHVRNETYAATLVRCRMSELEYELVEDGYSLIDQNDSGECCEDEDEPGFTCEWTVETVELPQPDSFTEDPEDALDDADDMADDMADDAMSDSSGSPLGALSAIHQSGGEALGEGAGLGDLAGLMGDSGAGPGGMIGMALGLVYPNLKPMLEASIRKVTVKVLWTEGRKDRDFTVVQYVTNPLEGSLNPNAADGLDELSELINAGSGDDEGDEE